VHRGGNAGHLPGSHLAPGTPSHPPPGGSQNPGGALLMTIAHASQALTLSVRQVWRLIGQRELAVVRAGRATRVTRASVEAFIQRGGCR
jgi:excisionase family DNA binding protein